MKHATLHRLSQDCEQTRPNPRERQVRARHWGVSPPQPDSRTRGSEGRRGDKRRTSGRSGYASTSQPAHMSVGAATHVHPFVCRRFFVPSVVRLEVLVRRGQAIKLWFPPLERSFWGAQPRRSMSHSVLLGLDEARRPLDGGGRPPSTDYLALQLNDLLAPAPRARGAAID
jgi:hypothetical protein